MLLLGNWVRLVAELATPHPVDTGDAIVDLAHTTQVLTLKAGHLIAPVLATGSVAHLTAPRSSTECPVTIMQNGADAGRGHSFRIDEKITSVPNPFDLLNRRESQDCTQTARKLFFRRSLAPLSDHEELLEYPR